MRNTNKKGFTIVELVIVVAVIAILAAVLIPTFAGIINKANQSADQQAVANMNKLLATEIEKKAENSDEVVEILIANGYNGNLSTYFKGYSLAFLASENAIVLVENDAIVYPKNLVGKTGYEVINPMATDADALVGGLTDGKVVFVGGDVTVDGLAPEAAGEYEVKLNGNTINASDIVGAWVDDAKLVVSNGVIDGSAITDDVVVYASRGGSVELNNVQVYAPAGTNPLQCYGGTLVLNNVTTAQSGEAHASWYNSAIQVINTIQQVEGKWTLYGEQAHTIINGGMYSGDKAIQISAPGANVTINGGTLTGTTYVIQGDFAPQNYGNSEGYESVITINGGNLIGNIKISLDTELVINGGTFSGETIQYQYLDANGAKKTTTVELTFENLSQFITTGSTVTINGETFTK